MSDGRIPAHISVSGLLRRAEALGGNATVLARGDRDVGSILVVLTERGMPSGMVERALLPSGRYGWSYRRVNDIEEKQRVDDRIANRRAADPDLWVVELDIPDTERFAAQMVADG